MPVRRVGRGGFTLQNGFDTLPWMPHAAAPFRIQDISSRENRWLKRFRAALRSERPDDDGYLALEGAKLVADALRAGASVRAVLVSASGERHLSSLHATPLESAQVLRVPDSLFAAVTGTETAQGIAALLRPHQHRLEDMAGTGNPLIVVLVGVQDPGNVGTIVRSAEAFGASGVIATRGTAHPLSAKALRASAGSALRVALVHGLAPSVALTQLRVYGVKTCAASLARGVEPAAADLRGSCALLIGNEGAGLAPDVERSADAAIRIPLHDGVDSLNAAMAATVLLYEAARQRRA